MPYENSTYSTSLSALGMVFFIYFIFFQIIKVYLESYIGSRNEPTELHRPRKQVTKAEEGPLEHGRKKGKGNVPGARASGPWRVPELWGQTVTGRGWGTEGDSLLRCGSQRPVYPYSSRKPSQVSVRIKLCLPLAPVMPLIAFKVTRVNKNDGNKTQPPTFIECSLPN